MIYYNRLFVNMKPGEDMEIKLPALEWFTAGLGKGDGVGNTWSGSVGTDPQTGCMGRPVFEYGADYVVYSKKDSEGNVIEKGKRIDVFRRVRPAWPEKLKPEDTATASFEASQDGLDKALVWLTSELEKSGIE